MVLNHDDRLQLSRMYNADYSCKRIADELGIKIGTVYRELRRGRTDVLDHNGRLTYDPELAQRTIHENIRRIGRRRRDNDESATQA